jgi:CubicO group peptidase (beta-lactamase class C family)
MSDLRLTRRTFVGVAALAAGQSSVCIESRAATADDRNKRGHAPALASQPNDHVISYEESPNDNTMQGFPPSQTNLVWLDTCESTQEKTRWTHLHVRELVPTHVVRRGLQSISVLPVASADLSEVRVPDDTKGETTVAEWLTQTDADAFLAMHDGKIIHEEYFHGMREDQPHLLWSATKSSAAGVVANQLAQGELKLDGPVTDYVPEMKGTGYDGATIRQCLDMRSGIAWDNKSDGEKNTWNRYRRANGFLARKLENEKPYEGECHALMTFEDFSKERARPHGGYFEYKDSDNRVVTWACEKVTGTRFADLVSQFIWSKLGCEYDADMLCDGLGSVSDGISVTLRDLARWGQMHLDCGSFNGHQIVPRHFIDDIQKNFDPKAITDESFLGPGIGLPRSTSYRSWFWIDMSPRANAYTSSGYLGQWCYILPKHRSVIAKISTWKLGETWNDYFATFRRDLVAFRKIAQAMDE